ncbi:MULTISPECIES: DUF1254 domain-containing protein [Streptomyces]|uniref:DUF1254 domain-containing protein n=2 Tax=Streptomyces TaxID=1883 RepID=A0A0L8JQ33_STRVR|nr:MULTISPECIES: DUF1254 domain-containing protein [Streptomyces]KOG15715.1 hypothetical protein ADK34_27055 [Streptomyces viridochromogenes]
MDAQTLKQQIATAHEKARADEGYWLGMAAFRYGFPLLEMHRSLWEWHVDTSAPTHLGAINEIHHTPRRAEPGDTYFVTPIVDAPYSRAFVDLSGGAVVLAVPPVTDRYFTVQLLDVYTNSFAYVGTRMGDTTGGDFLLARPGWRGTVPDGITRVITAPTPPLVCLLARVTILDDDVPAAVALQKRIALRPADPATPKPDPSANPPARDWRGEGGDPLDFHRMLADCLSASPPPAAEAGVLGLLARIGITPHRPFDPSRLHPTAVDGLRRAVADGLRDLYADMPFAGPSHNGWVMVDVDTIGDWGTDYFSRLEIAQIGLLANRAKEAYYIGAVLDGDGDPLSGEHRYELRFGPDDFPPVDAFWSLTMYLNPQGFLVENPIGRYHLGSLTKDLAFGPDGSLTLYLQRENPGPDKESNWLPTTEPGVLFRLILRQYLPTPDILTGRYAPPAVVRVDR